VLGHARMVRATARYLTAPQVFAREAAAASEVIKDRMVSYERDHALVTQALNDDPVVGKWSRVHRAIAQAAFWAIQKSQLYAVDIPTWMAAHEKGIEEGMSDVEAVAYADAMVSRAQGSGLLTERTGFERGTLGDRSRNVELARALTTFGSYMISGKLQVAMQQIRNSDRSLAGYLKLMTDLIVLYAIEGLAAAYLTGRWYDDEEDENLITWMTATSLKNVAGSFPMIRDMASVAEGFGGGGTYGAMIEGTYSTFAAPATIAKIAVGIEDEDKLRYAIKELLGGAGVMLHLPTMQLERALTAVFEKDMTVRDDFSAWDLAFGRRGD
jgi:hypothetical protein